MLLPPRNPAHIVHAAPSINNGKKKVNMTTTTQDSTSNHQVASDAQETEEANLLRLRRRHRQRRRSSARFLRLTELDHDNDNDNNNKDNEDNEDNNDVNDNQNDPDAAATATTKTTTTTTTTTRTTTQSSNDHPNHNHDNHDHNSNLSDMYRRAIRMNAENRINATNSWNFNLIDHMTSFLGDEDAEEEEEDNGQRSTQTTTSTTSTTRTSLSRSTLPPPLAAVPALSSTHSTSSSSRVNFTKASCTLDASVKIYSYRVDDVHLTSYKILANLHRSTESGNGGGKKNNHDTNDHDGGDHHDGGDDTQPSHRSNNNQNRRAPTITETLDPTGASINMVQLDSALQVDPLFHKMSKAFDEGGAKGLLLANLGVCTTGEACQIVFDSEENMEDDDDHEKKEKKEQEEDNNNNNNDDMMMMDISWFTQTLSTTSPLPMLVPQLQALRAEYATLKAQGFVDDATNHERMTSSTTTTTTTTSSTIKDKTSRRLSKIQRYASTLEEEQEAEISIHQEALERSRGAASALGKSYLEDDDDDDDDDDRPMEDYGGGGGHDDDDDDDDGFVFGTWGTPTMRGDGALMNLSMAASSSSSGGGGGRRLEDSLPLGSSPNSFINSNNNNNAASNQTTMAILDAMVSSQALLSDNHANSDYQYFDSQALMDKMMQVAPNQWAGSAHWKKMNRLRQHTKDGGTLDEDNDANDTSTTANKKKTSNKKKKKTTTTSKTMKERILVNLASPPTLEQLNRLLEQPPQTKKSSTTGRGGGKKRTTAAATVDPLVLSKAVMAKLEKTDHLLPLDVGMGLEQLTTLFLRPDINVATYLSTTTKSSSDSKHSKSVAFHSTLETTHGEGGHYDGDQYGDGDAFGGGDDDDDHENDGAGFSLADDDATFATTTDDNDVRLLEQGVRKVEKIRVGHATVAKKVDVRRLKHDLWEEMESTFLASSKHQANTLGDDDDMTTPPEDKDEASPEGKIDDATANDAEPAISFQKTVREMEAAKSQPDVTLPFYFICVLHLANEKGLELESLGLEDFVIRQKHEGTVEGVEATTTTVRPARRQASTAADRQENDDTSDNDSDLE